MTDLPTAQDVALVQMECAINDSASPLLAGYIPFYAKRGKHTCRPLALSATGLEKGLHA